MDTTTRPVAAGRGRFVSTAEREQLAENAAANLLFEMRAAVTDVLEDFANTAGSIEDEYGSAEAHGFESTRDLRLQATIAAVEREYGISISYVRNGGGQ